MSEQLIEVKFKATGRLGFSRERIAYRQFLEGIADINPNAQIVGAKDENEESEIRMTIRSLLDLRRKVPHGKAFAHDERQSPLDTEILVLFKKMAEEYAPNLMRISVESFYSWLREKHQIPYKFTTIDRSLRRLRAGDKIETDGEGRYWSAEAIRRVVA